MFFMVMVHSNIRDICFTEHIMLNIILFLNARMHKFQYFHTLVPFQISLYCYVIYSCNKGTVHENLFNPHY